MKTIRPVGEFIWVKPDAAPEKTEGGLFIPEKAQAKDRPLEGIVVAVGPGRHSTSGVLIPPEVKVGERVVFMKYTGRDKKVDDEKFTVLKPEEILAVIEAG